jgi:hypothetical protein
LFAAYVKVVAGTEYTVIITVSKESAKFICRKLEEEK